MRPEKVTFIYSSALPQAALHAEVNNGGGGGEETRVEEASGETLSSLGNSRLQGPCTILQTALVYPAAPLRAPLPVLSVSFPQPLALSSILLPLRPTCWPHYQHSNTSSPPASALHQEEKCDYLIYAINSKVS